MNTAHDACNHGAGRYLAFPPPREESQQHSSLVERSQDCMSLCWGVPSVSPLIKRTRFRCAVYNSDRDQYVFFLERYGRVNVEEVNEMVASRPKSTPSTIDHAFVVKAAFLCGLKATRLCSYIYIGRSCLEGWQSFGGIEDGWWHNLERLMVLMIMIMDTNMYIYINLSDQWSVSFRGRAEIPLFAC